jgi:DNA-binding response OmpR family regulator
MTTTPIRILVVDDDDDLLFLLKHRLSNLGFVVELCRDGIDCIAILRQFGANVVLLDLTMNGISGEKLCHEIREKDEFEQVRIMIMSGNHDIERIALSCGADGFISKPVVPEMIRSSLNELFGR